jgi:SSS family solute:Na+ symporter
MAHAAHLKVASNNDVVPALFGALVPAAVMSIGAANRFTRNFWKPYVNPHVGPAGEAKVAKMVSLVIKVGALVCILFLPTKFALDGLFSRRFGSTALLCGWAVGNVAGTWIAFGDGIKPVHTLHLGDAGVTLYTGLLALAVNVVVALVVQAVAGVAQRDVAGNNVA